MFVICVLHFSVVGLGSFLPQIEMSQIPKDIGHGCVVVLLDSQNTKLKTCFTKFRRLFEFDFGAFHRARECPERQVWADEQGSAAGVDKTACGRGIVKIGQIDIEDFRWSPTEPVKFIQANHNIYDAKDILVAVFPQKKKDRSCLMLPSSPISHPKAEAYRGPHYMEALLEFINVKCETYVSESGELNSDGLHRRTILASLFHVQNVSDVPMSAVNLHKRKSKMCDKANLNASLKVEARLRGSDDKLDLDVEVKEDEQVCPATEQNNQIGIKHKEIVTLPRCDRISMPTKHEFFRKYLKLSRPVIISNAAAHWPAIKKWTADFLHKSYGDAQVHIKLAPDGLFEGVEAADLWEDFNDFEIPPEVRKKLPYPDLVVVRPATQNVKFSEFLEIIQNSSRACKGGGDSRTKATPNVSAYLEYSSITTYFPELEDDIVQPNFVHNLLHRRHLNIWLSDGNTLGKLHFDPFDNLLCQLRGRKELIIYGPHNNTQLYEAHIPEAILGFDPVSQTFRRKKLLDSTSMVMSPVDILSPDHQRFPEFANTYPLNCTIDEGDILFMPAFWWHEVQSYPNREEGRNLAVNFWYEPFFTKDFPCADCRLDINPFYRHLL